MTESINIKPREGSFISSFCVSSSDYCVFQYCALCDVYSSVMLAVEVDNEMRKLMCIYSDNGWLIWRKVPKA
jgi:hypothetical protein